MANQLLVPLMFRMTVFSLIVMVRRFRCEICRVLCWRVMWLLTRCLVCNGTAMLYEAAPSVIPVSSSVLTKG